MQIGTCLTLPNLGFLWVFFKYSKISKNGNPLFFPVKRRRSSEDSKVNDSQGITSDLSCYNVVYLNVKFAKAFLFRFPGRFVQIEEFYILNNIFFSFETERQSDNRNDVMDISKG